MRKYVVRAEHVGRFTHATSLPISPTFASSALGSRKHCLGQARIVQRSQGPVRHLATATVDARLSHHGLVEAVENEHDARRAVNAILHSSTTTRSRLWPSLVEPYLPEYLQRQDRREADAIFADAETPLPIRNLHVWLAEARKRARPKRDLLTYLVVDEDRQDAVVWLVEAMLEEHAKALAASNPLAELPVVSQNQSLPSLEDATRSSREMTADRFVVNRAVGVDLDTLTDSQGPSASHRCLGEIWRSVGSMILRAADHELASPKPRSIMACVLRILAQLHHVGAVPSSIYNQTPSLDPSVLQRPPTLYFWSLRIMTDLSDVSFHSINPSPLLHQAEELSLEDAVATKGTGSSKGGPEHLTPEVEPQIWLDFVLWCCVEGGWVSEAAEIVYEMRKMSTKGRQYSVIDWNTLREQTAPKLPWTTRIQRAINGSRMREFAGGASLGMYDERASPLKPPERTVSSEVIAAIVDALANTAQIKPSAVEKHINFCKGMLDGKKLGLGSNSWDSIILRMYESLSSSANVPQTFLEQVISWSPPFLQEPDSANSAYQPNSVAQTYVADPSAVTLGLLHRMLLDFTLAGDFRASLETLRRLRKTVDANRRNNSDKSKAMVAGDPQLDGAEVSFQSTEQPEAPGLNAQLPAVVLAPFLELITDVKDFDLGRSLLYSDDIDGCTIPPNMYSEAVLQSALINFASAAGDKRLLDSVTSQLKPPLPEGVLRALLHHRINCREWQDVEDILEIFRDVDGLAWDATDVVALAGAILRLQETSNKADASWPGVLLQRVMTGQYNKAQDPSQPRDFSQTQMLNQLARVIASVPSGLGRDLLSFCDLSHNQLSAARDIPIRAFNAFLSIVIELFGIREGKVLCEGWCSSGYAKRPTGQAFSSGVDTVVEPNVQTFYVFLRLISLAKHRREEAGESTQSDGDESPGDLDGSTRISHRHGPEQGVIDWAAKRCVEQGVPWREIKREFPTLDIRASYEACSDPGREA
ncbi:MAG: hypothetical protein L6R40_003830 [Gallowayella cf. fulva]|nr:MAG: hypothetical protein L6R40_003830 [Xanthomendoza cf. fulva]